MVADVQTEEGTRAAHARRVYIASPLGFSEPGRLFYGTVLIPALEKNGFAVLDPWASPAAEQVAAAQALDDSAERLAALRHVNAAIGRGNREAIEAADALLAVLDGSDIDSGTASEIGFAAGLGKPVVGIRTDFRNVGDNEAAAINLQVLYFVEMHGGSLTASVDSAIESLSRVLPAQP